MTQPSTLERLAREIVMIFEPLGSIGQSPPMPIFLDATDDGSTSGLTSYTVPASVQLRQLLVDVGLDPVDLFPEVDDTLQTIATTVQTAWDAAAPLLNDTVEPDLGAILDAIQALEDTVASIGDLVGGDAGLDGSEVVSRLMDHLVVHHLTRRRPGVGKLLTLAGVINRDGRLDLDRIGDLLDDPVAAVAEHQGWGSEDLRTTPLLGQLQMLLLGLGADARLMFPPPDDPDDPDVPDPGADPDDGASSIPSFEPPEGGASLMIPLARLNPVTLGEVGIALTGLGTENGSHPGFAARLYGASRLDAADAPTGEQTRIAISGEVDGDVSLGVDIRPNEPITVTGDAAVSLDLSIDLTPPPRDEPRSLLRFGGLGGFEVGDTGIRMRVRLDEEGEHLRFAMILKSAGVRLDPDEADGFLAALLPAGGFSLGANVELGWASNTGLYLGVSGAKGLNTDIAIGLRVGGVLQVDTLHLRLVPEGTSLVLAVGVSGSARLGPITAAVGGVGFGATLHLRPDEDDPPPGVAIGPLTLEPRFRPPTAIGLAIDAGPLSGGGFIKLDHDAGRYEGALQLQLTEIGIHALGLVETQLPDGDDGYSLLLVLRSEFPPIALPFGFLLTSVGGLFGLQRRIDVDELRERFASGTVGNILAPEDPIGNAAALLEELGEVFPATAGTFVVGPTLQVAWTAVVTFDIGVFIELPGPSKVVLLGSARAAIDHPAGGTPYLQLRLDILGLLDPSAKTLEFDAVLIDSHLLEVFELTGGAAFRLHWGTPPHVVLSLGGFHPRYDPAPLEFPSSLTRISMTRGSRSDSFFLRFEGYLAVTANAFQLGAAAEMILRSDQFVAKGSFSFDLLVRFEPFAFELDLYASLSISAGSKTLAGVKVTGVLTGPGPVEFAGTLEFQVLFVTISWSDSFQFGSNTPPPLAPVIDLVSAFEPTLTNPANLRAVGGDDRDVLVEIVTSDTDRPVLSPLGRLVWQQRVAPLELLLEQFEGAPVSEPATLHIEGDHVVGIEHEHFAPGMFVDLTDAERLERGGYEEQVAGVVLAADEPVIPEPVSSSIKFKEYRIPEPAEHDGSSRLIAGWTLNAVDGEIPAAIHADVAFDVRPARYEVRDATDGRRRETTSAGSAATGVSEAQAHQLARHDHAATAVGLVNDVLPTPSL